MSARKRKSPRRPAKAKMISSLRQLAEQFNLTHTAVAKWTRHAEWPFSKEAPWPEREVPAMRVWAADTLKSGGAAAGGDVDEVTAIKRLSPKAKAEIRWILERTAWTKQRREIAAGLYVKKEDIDKANDEQEQRIIQNIAGVRYELSLVRLLAIKVEGKPAIEVEKILEEWAKGLCAKFAGDRQPPPEKAIEDASKKEAQPAAA